MSRLNYLGILCTSLILLLLGACTGMQTSPHATTDYDHSYDFSGIHKIAIQPIAKATLSTMMMTDEQINLINQALQTELLRRGFEVVADNAQADIFLSWKYLPPEHDDVSTFDPATQSIAGGTLYVTMVDPIRLQAVWRATFHSNLRGEADSALVFQYRKEAAEAILAQFPPDPAST